MWERRDAVGRENFFFLPSACHLFSRGVIFTRARVLLAVLSLREKRGTTRSLLFSLPNLYPPRSFPLIVPRALSYSSLSPVSHRHKMKLKQQRRRRLRKRHLKVNSRCLKLYRAYSISLNSSNVGNIFWSWILKGCIKQRRSQDFSKGGGGGHRQGYHPGIAYHIWFIPLLSLVYQRVQWYYRGMKAHIN